MMKFWQTTEVGLGQVLKSWELINVKHWLPTLYSRIINQCRAQAARFTFTNNQSNAQAASCSLKNNECKQSTNCWPYLWTIQCQPACHVYIRVYGGLSRSFTLKAPYLSNKMYILSAGPTHSRTLYFLLLGSSVSWQEWHVPLLFWGKAALRVSQMKAKKLSLLLLRAKRSPNNNVVNEVYIYWGEWGCFIPCCQCC